MALYNPRSILHLSRLLYVRPETFGPTLVCICSTPQKMDTVQDNIRLVVQEPMDSLVIDLFVLDMARFILYGLAITLTRTLSAVPR